jgi:hypothetical protein
VVDVLIQLFDKYSSNFDDSSEASTIDDNVLEKYPE